MDNSWRTEVTELARLTVTLTCAQRVFFEAEYSRHRRNPTTALLLCLLLGIVGAQTFYLEGRSAGLKRLLFCWTLIPALLALWEAPQMAERAREYNTDLAHALLALMDVTPYGGAATSTAPYMRTNAEATHQHDTHTAQELAASLTAVKMVKDAVNGDATASALSAGSVTQAPLLATTPDPDASRTPVLSYAVDAAKRDSAHISRGDGVEPEAMQTPLLSLAPQRKRYVQHITVRKMALIDGEVRAEATAERRVPLDGRADAVQQRIAEATDAARAEALRTLAQNQDPEIAEAAQRELDGAPVPAGQKSRVRVE